MIRYECDRCGAPMSGNDARRFIVRLEVFAAAGHVELDPDKVGKPGEQLARVIDELSRADPDDVEDRTYRCLRFDVCDDCRRILLQRPLG